MVDRAIEKAHDKRIDVAHNVHRNTGFDTLGPLHPCTVPTQLGSLRDMMGKHALTQLGKRSYPMNNWRNRTTRYDGQTHAQPTLCDMMGKAYSQPTLRDMMGKAYSQVTLRDMMGRHRHGLGLYALSHKPF